MSELKIPEDLKEDYAACGEKSCFICRLIERIARIEAELAEARAIASGVTHHDECWRQSPEYARMKAYCDRLTSILAGATKEETAEKIFLVAKMNTRSVHILAEELWLAARAQKEGK